MPLVPAICTQCGANLEVDSTKEAAVCPFCSTPFITEKAINNYNTTNITNIEALHADVINVHDEKSTDNRVKAADTFIKLKDYYSADEIFLKLTEECPYDYRGWWGLIRIITEDFTKMELSSSGFDLIEDYFNKACTVAKDNEREAITAIYNPYCEKARYSTELKLEILNQELAQLEAERDNAIQELNKRIEDLDRKIPGSFICGFSRFLTVSLCVAGAIITVIIFNSITHNTTMWNMLSDLFFATLFSGIIGYILSRIVNGIFNRKIRKLTNKRSALFTQRSSCYDNYKQKISKANYEIDKLTNY